MTETIIFEIILHAGNARAEAYQALKTAKDGDFVLAAMQLSQAEAEIAIAHRVQADLIQQEVQGEPVAMTMLLVHAQDHLMTAIAEKNLLENMVEMQQTIHRLSRKIEADR